MNAPIDALRQVAFALGPLRGDVVFVGGAVASLVISDMGSEGVRPTDDIDLIVPALSRPDFARFESRLRDLGFRHDTSDGAPICRFVYESIPVDVMPTLPAILGFSNRWYAYAIDSANQIELPDGPTIRIIGPVAFVATKLEAFQSPNREHAGDILASRDLEDVITVLDGVPDFAEAFDDAPLDVQGYIRNAFRDLLNRAAFVTSLEGLIAPGPTRADRAQSMIRLLEQITA
ncbi:MAG: hypothetical protein Rubg2KO_29670 [Rubricoccaceae bacterium]